MAIVVTSAQSTTEAKSTQASADSGVKEADTKSESANQPDETKEASGTSENDSQDETEDQDETDEEEIQAKDDSEESDEDKPKKRNGFKKRIDKLRHQTSLARQEAEYWKEQALKSKSQKTESKSEASVNQKSDRPVPEDFETHDAYVDALTDWKMDQREKQRETKQRETEARTAQEKLNETFKSKCKKFAKTCDDFEEVLEEVDDIMLSPALQSLFQESDNGPELMYELSKNRKELERINELGPLAAARELGKFESRLTKEEPREETKTTKAPKPLSPVGKGGSAVKKSIFDKNISFAEYEALRREQIRARRA